MLRHNFWALLQVLMVGAVLLIPQAGVQAQATNPVPTLHAGWNLIAGTGQLLLGEKFGASAYTFQPGDTAYQAVTGHTPLQMGFGYWVQVTADSPTPLRAGSNSPYQVRAPAGQSFMAGNPSGTQPALVAGADSVLTYDPVNGYQQTTTLQPGQGAWVLSSSGGTITVTPQGAQASQPADGSRTISSPNGYGYKVPADWQLVPATAEAKKAGVDQMTTSPDGQNSASVSTGTEPAAAGFNVILLLGDALAEVQKKDPSRDVIVAPKPTTSEVAGADNAAYVVSIYTGVRTGKTHVVIDVAANRGGTLYILSVDSFSDYFNENQERIGRSPIRFRSRPLLHRQRAVPAPPALNPYQQVPPSPTILTTQTAVSFRDRSAAPAGREAISMANFSLRSRILLLVVR